MFTNGCIFSVEWRNFTFSINFFFSPDRAFSLPLATFVCRPGNPRLECRDNEALSVTRFITALPAVATNPIMT